MAIKIAGTTVIDDSRNINIQTVQVGTNTVTTVSDIALSANVAINAENSLSFGMTDGTSGYYRWMFGNNSKTGGTAGGVEKMRLDKDGNLTLAGTVDGVDIQTLNTTASSALPKAGGTMSGNLTVSKTDPLIRLYDSNTGTGTFPAIEFDTANNQGVAIEFNEFDGELPVSGYGLVVKESSTNTQFPSSGTLSFNVLGDIYAGATSLGSLNKVFHDGYHPNADDADTLDGQHGSYYTGYTDTAIANLVDSSPATLDTLNELAAALGDDANFSTTITDSIATKLPLAGGTLTGDLLIDSTDAEINLKAGVTGTSAALNWTFNTAGTNYASIKLPYDTRATTGLHIDSGYPITLDATTRIDFDIAGTTYATLDTSGLSIGSNDVFHDGYHPNADKWTNARTLTLSGDASGSVSWDGSANATLTVAIADDSHNHTLANIDQVTINSTNDLDTYTTRGLYIWGGVTPANSPSTYGSMIVLPDGSQPQQLLQTYGGAANKVSLYGRRKTSNTWDTVWTQYFSDHYHPNADKWTTARTLTLTGDVTGSVTWDGSGNATITTDWRGGQANTTLNMNNYSIINANNLTFGDPGPNEGITWNGGNGWNIYESPDDLTTNSGGNLQFVQSSTRRMTLNTNGDLDIVGGNLLVGINKGIVNSGGWTRNTTPYGYIEFGPNNTSWAHIYTDRSNFYFNKNLYVLGEKVYHNAYHPEADKWTTARTLSLTGDASGSVTWDGSANVSLSVTVANDSHTHSHLIAVDDRDMKPNTSGVGSGVKGIKAFFSSYGGMTGTADTDYQDVLVLDTYSDTSGGNANAITLDKSSSAMRIWNAAQGATSWGTPQRVFADNYHPNADKWTTARTLSLSGDASGSVSWDGSANATLSVTVANDSHTHAYNNLTDKGSGTGNYITTGQYRWGSGSGTFSGNPRSAVIGYSGGNYGQIGYGWHPTGTSGVHTSQIADLQSRIDLRDGIVVFGSGSTQAVGSTVSWTEVLDCRTGTFQYKGNNIFHDGYHPNADKWTTARSHTVTLTGDVTGTATQSVDGTGNKTWSITTTVADDSHTHDTRYMRTDTQGLTSDINTIASKSAVVRWNNTTTGRPADSQANEYGPLLQMAYDGNIVSQLAHDFDQDNLYFRNLTTSSDTGTSWKKIWNSGNDGSGSGLDADLLDGLQLTSQNRNNQANRVVRTQGSGYAEFGWINTTSGNTTSTLTDIYVNTNDGYIRKATPAHFRSQITDGVYYPVSNPNGYTTYTANQPLNTNSNATFNALYVAGEIIHSGDTNTYISFHAEDHWRVVTGGAERLEVNNSQITSTEPIHAPSFHGDGSSLTNLNIATPLTALSTGTDATGSDLIPVYDVSAGTWEKQTITNAALQGPAGVNAAPTGGESVAYGVPESTDDTPETAGQIYIRNAANTGRITSGLWVLQSQTTPSYIRMAYSGTGEAANLRKDSLIRLGQSNGQISYVYTQDHWATFNITGYTDYGTYIEFTVGAPFAYAGGFFTSAAAQLIWTSPGAYTTTAGAVGTYAWLWRDNAYTQIGTTHAGSTLFYSTISDGNSTGAVAHVYKTVGTVRSGISPSGTWRSMGSAGTYSAAYGQATLYVRIS